ncbi:unnamed protein product [Paramecium sonneborni]|uniref:Transmembrane protein n=1 Tax=Paramecium sonneborni TaxID=65129 RepID=A0A8S1L5A4_9CILI|nr:unnamed protein product [Paramecium sonneborni]
MPKQINIQMRFNLSRTLPQFHLFLMNIQDNVFLLLELQLYSLMAIVYRMYFCYGIQKLVQKNFHNQIHLELFQSPFSIQVLVHHLNLFLLLVYSLNLKQM